MKNLIHIYLFLVGLGSLALATSNEVATNTVVDTLQYNPNDGIVMMESIVFSNAAANAENDFSTGRYRILTWGFLPMEHSAWARHLAVNYSVSVQDIAGCLIDQELSRRATEYNQRMKKLLNKKFGKDIFVEATEVANKELELERPTK